MYKKYKTIGIDLDNTVWNLGETVVNQINKKYNLNIDYNDCPYNLDATFNQYPQITDDINDLYYDAIAYVIFTYENDDATAICDVLCKYLYGNFRN